MSGVQYAFVHGGLHGSWCWDRVRHALRAESVAIDLPGRDGDPSHFDSITFEDWIVSAVDQIDATGYDDIVLVGHSLGGISVPAIAARRPDLIRRLVFVSCIVPEEGATAIDTIARDAVDAFGPDGGFHPPPREIAELLLCNDIEDRDVIDDVIDRLRPEPRGPMVTPISRADMPNVPRTFVRLRRDNAMTPETQSLMIEHLGGAHEVEIDAGHNVMISRPTELARLLETLADAS